MCIVACASMFSSCSNDDSYPDNAASKFQTETGTNTLRSTPAPTTGEIVGSFYPAVQASAMATDAKGNRYQGMIYGAGQFQILALPPEIYTVTITPKKTSPLLPITESNVQVRVGTTTHISMSFYVEE